MTVLEQAATNIRRWRLNPLAFVTEEIKAQPDPWQVDALDALGDPARRRIAMQACKGPGKTAFLAWAILWFLSCWGEEGSHPKGAATSITEANIDDNLWPEIAKWMSRSEFLKRAFVWKKERVYSRDHPETWFFSKRTWPKHADKNRQAETLAGLHADFLLFILDESGGIPEFVMAAAEGGLATGKWCKIIQAGNPTHLEGPLYRAATVESNLWYLIRITGDPDDPKRSTRISKVWAREQIEKYGRDNPWVLVNVFGHFPPASINVLLGPDEVDAAMNRNLPLDAYSWAQKRLGIDVARYGDDRTVITPRQGLAAFRSVDMRHERGSAVSVDIANRVMMAKKQWDSEMEIFDDTVGWAHGAIDVMRNAGHAPMAVQFHGKAFDPKYFNMRSYMWMMMAQWVQRGAALPKSPMLKADLTVTTYTFIKGKFAIEDKDLVKIKLGGRSPDEGDSLGLTFAIPDMPGRNNPVHQALQRDQKAASDWDPFDPKRI